jgi:replicative DNA helicase Mcm
MREASSDGSMAITLRQLESLVRIAEARARAALRAEVTVEDAEAAILIMNRSLEDVGMDTSTMKVDVDTILTGKPKGVRDMLQVLLDAIYEVQRETGLAELNVVLDEAEKRGISRSECERLIAQLKREGTVYEPREGYLKKT